MRVPDKPHLRLNPLTGRRVLVSPHRLSRPWSGEIQQADAHADVYDPECHLCPGNQRVGGHRNPDYDGVFAFDNDFPALLDSPDNGTVGSDLFRVEPARGSCRVVCFSPDHSKTLPELSTGSLRAVINCWSDETAAFGERYQWVQIFENKGPMMGCSNPHPHSQIWATDHLPDEAKIEDKRQAAYKTERGGALLAEVVESEMQAGDRVVVETKHWLAIVPFWASWPFETLVLPKDDVRRFPELSSDQRDDLALALKTLTIRYDNLFECSFPYSMGWHGAPYSTAANSHWRLHAHFYPPLLRSAAVRKFMVGYEMMAEAQRDLTPEQAAHMLRETATIHYRTD